MTTALTPYHAARQSQGMARRGGDPRSRRKRRLGAHPWRALFSHDKRRHHHRLRAAARSAARFSHRRHAQRFAGAAPEAAARDPARRTLDAQYRSLRRPILSTWFDRPLSIAGRVFIRGEDWAHPQSTLVELPEKVTIPSLAAHMKRGDEPDQSAKRAARPLGNE